MRSPSRPFLLLALATAILLAGCTSSPSDSADAPPAGSATTPAGSPSDDVGAASASGAPTPGTTIVPPAATGPTPTNGHATSAPTAPLVVALQAEDARAFFGAGTRVTLTVSGSAFDDVRAGLALPQGVELLDGNLSYGGAFDGRALTLAATVRASAPGTYALRGWVEAALPVGSRIAPAAVLEAQGDATSATFRTGALPRPDVRVALTPQGFTAADVVITSSVAMGARLVLDAPDAFASANALDERFTLTPGESLTRHVELGPPARWEGTGYQTLTVYLYPDAAVDGRLHAAMLHYWWEGDTLRVSATPPAGPSGGSSAGPSTGGEGGATPQPVTPS